MWYCGERWGRDIDLSRQRHDTTRHIATLWTAVSLFLDIKNSDFWSERTTRQLTYFFNIFVILVLLVLVLNDIVFISTQHLKRKYFFHHLCRNTAPLIRFFAISFFEFPSTYQTYILHREKSVPSLLLEYFKFSSISRANDGQILAGLRSQQFATMLMLQVKRFAARQWSAVVPPSSFRLGILSLRHQDFYIL